MKRLRLILAASTAIALGLSATALASNGHVHRRVGLGFYNVEAPVGVRLWFPGQKLALDLGIGFNSEPAAIDASEKETRFAFDVGLPCVWHSWERVHALVRPGILYQRQQIGFDADGTTPGIQFDTESATTLDFLLGGEAEIFLADNVSVSAAHGISLRRFDPGFGADTETSFGTYGNNFTTIGFHIYMFK